ncbi:NAD(P)H-dependent glycerol-3-phosphate dehydrogenase [Acidobacteriota bacterium]
MKASVIGGGSWGSAFALHLGRLNIETNLWIREKDVYEITTKTKENKTFLPGFIFPPHVSFFDDLRKAVQFSEVVIIAVPSKFCRQLYTKLAPFLSHNHILVSLTKGIEEGSLKRMSEVMEEVFTPYFKPTIVSLTGPSFAKEVAASQPTAVVASSKNMTVAIKVQHFCSDLYFRIYTCDDLVGLELAGALKNVIAIAAGISDGLQFGNNSKAALITRGIAEMTRLGLKFGAKLQTFAGLAGIGDLVLTCTSDLSRNYFVGFELGKGKSLKEIVSKMKMIAEGVTTTLSVFQLSKKERVEMPICEQVYRILYRNKDPRQALKDLLSRKLKNEYYF